MATVEELKRIASQVRRDIVRMVTDAKSGHPGGSLSSADVLTALYFNEMKIDPENHETDKQEWIFCLILWQDALFAITKQIQDGPSEITFLSQKKVPCHQSGNR